MNNIVYILHGLGADSNSNWFPWLKQKLKKRGYTVAVPNFPSSAVPKLDEWLSVLKSTIGQYGEGILIGHSLGGLLAIQYLLSGGQAPKVILAATPFEKASILPELDGFFPTLEAVKSLRRAKFIPTSPVDKMVELVKDELQPRPTEFIILQSDNDPLVHMESAKKWADALGAKLVVLPGLGHFDIETLPEILDCLS